MKILRFFAEQIVYLLINLILFLIAFVFLYLGYAPDNTPRKNAIYLSIGTSLIAAGIVAALELWKDLSRNKMLMRINNVILEAGIEAAFVKRDLDKYDRLMRGLKDQLDITGYSLNAFYESYCDLLTSRIAECRSLRVRMLVVAPQSKFSKQRAQSEGRDGQAFRDSVNRLTSRFSTYDRVEIRQIDEPLTTMIFRVDDAMFVGPHLHRKPSKSTLTLELAREGWLFAEYEREFDSLWNDAVPVGEA